MLRIALGRRAHNGRLGLVFAIREKKCPESWTNLDQIESMMDSRFGNRNWSRWGRKPSECDSSIPQDDGRERVAIHRRSGGPQVREQLGHDPALPKLSFTSYNLRQDTYYRALQD